MILYHGSSLGGITELKPFLSEHKKPYIYLASNPVVALLYTVKPVPKPFSFYPYGFNGEKVVYSEYYENCFADIYKGQKGFLYKCENIKNLETPTAINCAYTCQTPIKICNCIEIDDVFEKFMDYEAKGLFEIKPLESISEKELNFVYDDIRKNIVEHNLKNYPDNPMSKFIVTHFPKIWFE
ncbi:MAG: hypothetical protein IJZ16_03035 [Clostridia bacterium]|nr:hypothetical protein [Clostridia bacterium]